jgi:hypothetical protein
MDSAKINDWMQVIGIFALVASLVFVGLEMRQSQKIALSAAYQARADSSMNLRMAPFESETLQTAMAKVNIQEMSLDQLTPEELIVLRGRWSTQLVYLENMHYQYLNGFITEEHWQTNRFELMRMLSRIPEWRRGTAENCEYMRDSFCAEVKAAVERINSSKD